MEMKYKFYVNEWVERRGGQGGGGRGGGQLLLLLLAWALRRWHCCELEAHHLPTSPAIALPGTPLDNSHPDNSHPSTHTHTPSKPARSPAHPPTSLALPPSHSRVRLPPPLHPLCCAPRAGLAPPSSSGCWA